MKTKIVILFLMVSAAMSAQKIIKITFYYTGSDCPTPIVSVPIQGVDKLFLVDSGASVSMIDCSSKNTFTFPVSDNNLDFNIYDANGNMLSTTKKYKVPGFGSFF